MLLLNLLYGMLSLGYEFQKLEYNDYPFNLLVDWLVPATYVVLFCIYGIIMAVQFGRIRMTARLLAQDHPLAQVL
jgi:hypothetical protein